MHTEESSRVSIQHSKSRVHGDHIGSHTTSILTSLDLERLECYTLWVAKVTDLEKSNYS